MASLYIIAIGGTGAKCAEAITHAVAAGLFTPKSKAKGAKIKILFVDPDEANGNVDRATKTIKIYQRCYDLFKDSNSADGQGQFPWNMPSGTAKHGTAHVNNNRDNRLALRSQETVIEDEPHKLWLRWITDFSAIAGEG